MSGKKCVVKNTVEICKNVSSKSIFSMFERFGQRVHVTINQITDESCMENWTNMASILFSSMMRMRSLDKELLKL